MVSRNRDNITGMGTSQRKKATPNPKKSKQNRSRTAQNNHKRAKTIELSPSRPSQINDPIEGSMDCSYLLMPQNKSASFVNNYRTRRDENLVKMIVEELRSDFQGFCKDFLTDFKNEIKQEIRDLFKLSNSSSNMARLQPQEKHVERGSTDYYPPQLNNTVLSKKFEELGKLIKSNNRKINKNQRNLSYEIQSLREPTQFYQAKERYTEGPADMSKHPFVYDPMLGNFRSFSPFQLKQRQITASTGKKPRRQQQRKKQQTRRPTRKPKERRTSGVGEGGLKGPKILRVSYLNQSLKIN